MASIALIKHAVSRSYSMGKQAERDLKDTEDSLFASLACDASPVVVAGNASAFYRAHQAAAATIAFQSAVNKSGREYSNAADALDDTLRMRLALDNLLAVAPYLVHVDCPCPACAEPERDDPPVDAPITAEPDDDNPF